MEKMRAKKALGQNFLIDDNVLTRIVSAVAPTPDDAILEVGPGRGALTRLLVASGATFLAVEWDRDLLPLLQGEFGSNPKVEIGHGDIMRVDLPLLLSTRAPGKKWKVAANLPYNISSQVLFRFMECSAFFERMVLMLQKEVGDRLTAEPGSKEYGALTVLLQLHFDIRREFIVKPGSFRPIPKVDSAVLRFTPLSHPRFDVGDEEFFRRVVKGAFNQRRKTLYNTLRASGFATEEGVLQEALLRCGIDGGRRGETLSLEEFAALSRELQKGKIVA